jgi:uncharacterized protein (DUF302 family)
MGKGWSAFMAVRKINVQRWSITSQKPFENVVASVEANVGKPNIADFAARIAAAKTYSEVQDVVSRAVGESGLMEFMRIDAGAVLAKAGGNPKSIRLIVGNPVIMQSMARLAPDAASYAPVTILIDQRLDGVHLSYDEMESFLDCYGDPEVLAIARDLDAKVKRLLREAS